MKISVKSRSGKDMGTFTVTASTTAAQFKDMFHSSNKKFYPTRQRFTVNEARGTALGDGPLSSFGVKDGSVLYFKDLGPQISWKLVFLVEYFGPLWIFPLFMYAPGIVYGVSDPERSLVQKVAFGLVLFHYVKRELETLFVHRFSNATMPITSLPKNCSHYWGLFAALVGYFLFHPRYKAPFSDDQTTEIYGLAGLMLLFELLNLKTHLVLKNLRPPGTKVRGIPMGWGFQLVSCANYMWESAAWLTFCFLVQCLTCWIFLFIAFAQMSEWAVKKHANYKKEFGDKYPWMRSAIIPLIV
uniref:Ubiquitin-like domain-containing protein n=1 Tax=Chromera velia CCMP2878 TaxID=1169474 RepID=A0A0G4HUS2_9ALVE|mmetsp:Transcript_27919/g.54733  ORF Transcript_27919/g.54733 Transcript_27919/m.54733 type:complete len:299 (-) Transcript_27919:221-1117(-)|eukprot:Cvel_8679.t1-p1 / transcript=Cvel_8679.t1 / gene=Cvel_8679 / organism=Chromera_velia_CCMP2878 / gene_product=Very-long-chain enoyl-CoA reductase, putative / transcript_product=Very-long-chain enoyl-CoA reductase, putative / location=Cvel_scaffold484:46197-49982(-) / protein_length=298 / sequence_SO=supercontig / SO=protein_coding / is_pseudo=false